MEKIILGLLLMKDMTTYELRAAIEAYFSSMCSNSLGSIQAALKKLHEKEMVTFSEMTEHSVNKKYYHITEAGKKSFFTWTKTAMTAGKAKDMELSKLLFMGYVPPQERLALIDAYIAELKRETAQLMSIKNQDFESAMMQYIVYLKAEGRVESFLKDTGYSSARDGVEQVTKFELLALQYGIDKLEFDIHWFEALKRNL